MQATGDNHNLLARYLLGYLSEEEQTAVEARYFVDDGFFEQLVAAEKELIGSYLRGDLSLEDHDRFQRRYLTVGYRRKMVESAQKSMDAPDQLRLPAAPIQVDSDRRSLWDRLLQRAKR